MTCTEGDTGNVYLFKACYKMCCAAKKTSATL